MTESEVDLRKYLRNAIYSFAMLAIISVVLSANEETGNSILHLALAFLVLDGVAILLMLISIWVKRQPYT